MATFSALNVATACCYCIVSLQFKGAVCGCPPIQRAGLRSWCRMVIGEPSAVIFGAFLIFLLWQCIFVCFRWNNQFGAENLCKDMGKNMISIDVKQHLGRLSRTKNWISFFSIGVSLTLYEGSKFHPNNDFFCTLISSGTFLVFTKNIVLCCKFNIFSGERGTHLC